MIKKKGSNGKPFRAGPAGRAVVIGLCRVLLRLHVVVPVRRLRRNLGDLGEHRLGQNVGVSGSGAALAKLHSPAAPRLESFTRSSIRHSDRVPQQKLLCTICALRVSCSSMPRITGGPSTRMNSVVVSPVKTVEYHFTPNQYRSRCGYIAGRVPSPARDAMFFARNWQASLQEKVG